ncbi:MAG: putative dehydrogenase [Kiritimatiellia bacterium]|jgi:predicted dehydrogenase
MKTVNIAILGHGFMGRAHSNGWSQASRFFDLPVRPVLQVACGRDEASTRAFADRWGWASVETDWRAAIARPDVDVVDICLPQTLHAEAAILAAEHGKHIFCEKPLCISTAEGQAMIDAVERAGVVHYVNHNYRRVPAVAQARRLIDEGAIGQIYHWRGAYQQSWLLDPSKPLDWKLKKETAFAGPHIDLNSHSVDLAHYLVGELSSVSCLTRTFIEERPLAEDPSRMGKVEIDDASLMMVEFANGAIGSFEASRFATGRRNHHTFEIYGSKGALCFDLEHFNRLQFYSMDDAEASRGFRDILVTEPQHPYVGHWWPPGHVIGYEHTFVHAVVDFLEAVSGGTPVRPDFHDGLKVVKVLEAGLLSAETGQRIRL